MISLNHVRELIKKQPSVAVKYVNVGGNYRFNFTENLKVTHCDMIEKDERPTSAGFFMVSEQRLFIQDAFSSTLDLGPHPNDETNLRKIFGIT